MVHCSALFSCNGILIGSLSEGQAGDSAMVQGKDCRVGAATLYIHMLRWLQRCSNLCGLAFSWIAMPTFPC